MYGDADNNKTDESIQVTFGHSKKHCKDLKRFVWSMSVSSDHAFPLFQQAYSGNTADVTTYVEQWQRLIDLLGRQDFLYVADSKLISHQTMAHIHDNDGFFVAPAPMNESYKKVFEEALQNQKYTFSKSEIQVKSHKDGLRSEDQGIGTLIKNPDPERPSLSRMQPWSIG